MYADEDLIKACCQQLTERNLRGVQSSRSWDRLHEQVDRYRLFCDLSRGPDPMRSEYYRIKARAAENALRRRVDEPCEVGR